MPKRACPGDFEGSDEEQQKKRKIGEKWSSQGQSSGDHWGSSTSWLGPWSGQGGWGPSENRSSRHAPVDDWKQKSLANLEKQHADNYTDDEGVLMPEDSEIDGLVSDSTFDRCRCCYRFLANDMFTQSQKNRKDPGNRACKDCVIQQNNRKEDFNAAKGNRHRLHLMFLQRGCDRDKRMSSSIEENVQGGEGVKE